MALRVSFAAVLVPFLFVACGDSTSSPASLAGASSAGMTSGAAGSDGGGAKGSSGAAGASVGGAGTSGASPHGSAGVGVAANAGSGGSGGIPASGGGEIGLGVAGTTAASAGAAGSDAMAGGIPGGWIVVDDVDYSKVPGPNFETVRLMFAGSPCSGSSCHYGGRNHLQVGKPADQLYAYLINFKTLECGKLIDTANPSQSAIVKYLRGPCGMIERMPSGKCFDDGDPQCVPEYYIQAIEQWIESGAPR